MVVNITQYFEKGFVAPDIVKFYQEDLRREAANSIDIEHSNFLLRYSRYLSSNEFLDHISDDMSDFGKNISENFSDVTFTIKGRIKSIVRSEEKFNGYIIEHCTDYYNRYGVFPSEEDTKKFLTRYRDTIAYRIVISVPVQNLNGRDKQKAELEYLYKIANNLPAFFMQKGYSMEEASKILGATKKRKKHQFSSILSPENRHYFKDYIENPKENNYRSLHVALRDNYSFVNIEIQLRTIEMDNEIELGINSNHDTYEVKQMTSRKSGNELKIGECKYFEDALERYNLLHDYDFTKAIIDNFFAVKLPNGVVAYNDHAGVKYGREINPREYLTTGKN